MLKNMKVKALAVLAALAMMLGLGAVATTAAYAAGTATITVSSADKEFNDKKVTAIRMFKRTDDGSGYALEEVWKTFFTEEIHLTNDNSLSQKAFEYVLSLDENGDITDTKTNGSDKKLVEFARKAKTWATATDNADALTTLTATSQPAVQSGSQYVATVSGIDYGYYLVYPQSGSTSVPRHTDAMLVNADEDVAQLTLKSEYPTVDKSIVKNPDQDGGLGVGVDDGWGGNHGMELESLSPEFRAISNNGASSDAQVGDTVYFQLESKVPDMSEYSDYYFQFQDILSKGLAFNEILSVKVGDKELTRGTGDYTYTLVGPTPEGAEGANKITIKLNDFFAKYNNTEYIGKPIVVQYSAKITEDAESGKNPNTNQATVDYGNNPDDLQSSQPDTTKTYTGDFTIDKYTGTYGENATRLAEAKFEIVKGGDTADDGTVMAFQTVNAGSDTAPLTVVYDSDNSEGTTTLITPESGKIHVTGLGAGTYWIRETDAPDGYNKLAKPIKVVIKMTYDDTTGELASYTVTYGDSETQAANGVIPVENKTGTVLPGTGGMGTVLFTVAGVALIAFGVFWSLKRAKSADRRH